MSFHEEKIAEQLKALAMTFVQKESNRTSLVTVTDIRVESKKNITTVLVSVLPQDKEDAVIDFLKRKRSEFREYVKGHARLRAIPTFDFAIDRGEKNRQLMDKIV